jgi:hypothetical protein
MVMIGHARFNLTAFYKKKSQMKLTAQYLNNFDLRGHDSILFCEFHLTFKKQIINR